MAYRILPFVATIPAGTLQAAPITIDLDLDNWVIEALDLEVPPGPAGLMGFQVFNNGVAWVPYGGGEWLVWDDVKERYQLTDQPNASGWQVVGYNTGTYNHVVILRFHVNPVTNAQTVPAVPTVTVINPAPAPAPAFVL